MRAFLLASSLAAVAVALIGLALTLGAGVSARDAEELIAQAEALYDRWDGEGFDFAAYEGKLRRAIALWEAALPLIPEEEVQTRAHVLNRLSQAYFELAEGYLTSREEEDRAYGKGKDYALESLRLDPEFTRIEEREGFRAALRSAGDVEAIFWYGNNLGKWLNYHYGVALTGGTGDVLAAFERSVELDERYLAGGPHRALAGFLAQVPSFLGGSRKRAKPHFERSIQLGPDYLENYVNYADYYAKPEREWELFCSLLKTALEKAQDPAVMAKWPFYNTLALRRAQALWNYRYRGERVCGG